LTLYDVGFETGVSFVVMELLQGENLQARIDRAPLPWKDCLDVALAVSEGLEAAHARGVVHGDLKPENIFVTTDGLVKIVDFGLARPETLAGAVHTSRAPTWVEPAPGSLAGTVLYMAPEQVRGTPGDARSDLFAFGCTLHAMLTGAPPFLRDSVGEVLAAILRDPVPALTPAQAVPPALEQLLHACLRKQPEERLQTARELRIALRAVTDGARSGARRHRAPPVAGAVAASTRSPSCRSHPPAPIRAPSTCATVSPTASSTRCRSCRVCASWRSPRCCATRDAASTHRSSAAR